MVPHLPVGKRDRATRALAASLVGLGLGLAASDVRAQEQPKTIRSQPTARTLPESLEFANRLFQNRRYKEAVEEYEAFLKSKDGSQLDQADGRYGLATALLFLNRIKDARAEYDAFIKMAPVNHYALATAVFRHGEASYFLNELGPAKASLERFAKVAGEREARYLDTALAYLGDVCLGLARETPAQAEPLWDQAKSSYEQALKLNPTAAIASRSKLGLGRALTYLKQFEAAKAVLADLARTGGEGWADRAYYQIALIEAANGRDAEAAAAYASLEKAAPRSRMIPDARLQRAEALLRLKDAEQAAQVLTSLINDPAAPPNLAAEGYDALGRAWAAADQPGKAVEALDEGVKKFPARPFSSLMRSRAAEALLAQKQEPEARKRLAALAKEEAPDDPYVPQAALRAAGLALDAQDRAQARELAGVVLKGFPNHSRVAEARLIDARAALGENQAKDAIASLTALLGNDHPDESIELAARYYLGLAYRADGQKDKAIATLESLAKIQPGPKAGPGASTTIADANFLLGQAYVEAKQFDRAIPALDAYLNAPRPDKSAPELADYALAYLANAQAETGKKDEAKATLERLEKEHPKSPALAAARIRRAGLEAESDPGKAEALYMAASNAEGATPAAKVEALWSLAWLRVKKEPAKAVESFDAILKLDPKHPRAAESALGKAAALALAKQDAAALDAYDRAASYPEVAGRALVGKARLLSAGTKPKEAAEAYGKAVEGYAGFGPEFSKAEPLDVLLADWGWALIDSGQQKEADAAFARLLKEFPEGPRTVDARINLAESAFAAGKHDEVKALIEPVLADSSKADDRQKQSARYRLGRSRIEAGDWAGAAALFDALASDSKTPFAREAGFWKAETLFQQNRPKDAEAAFSSLIAASPAANEAPELVSTARRRKVLCLVQLDRWKDALTAADDFLKAHPEDAQKAEVQYARGRALQGQARFDEARAEFDKVVAARKGSELAAQAQFMKGETFFHQKNYRDARREFFQVAYGYALPKWQALALLEAGKVQEQLQQWPEAVATYEELLSKHPDEPPAKTAKDRLADLKKKVVAEGKTDGS